MGVFKRTPTEVNPELSDENIKKLAEFFYFLWQLDERNKREGRYEKNNESKVGYDDRNLIN